MSIDDKLKKAKIKLFKRSENLDFFAACLYKFEWEIFEDENDDREGYVKLNYTQEGKLEHNGIIYLNKKILEQEDYDHNNLLWLLIHELLHILNKHLNRKNNKDHKIWNFACDHVIERDMFNIFQNNIYPYQNKYNIFNEIDDIKPNCTAEEAYDILNTMSNNNQVKYTGSKNNVSSFEVDDSNQKIDIDEDYNYGNENENPENIELKNIEKQIQEDAATMNQMMQQQNEKNRSNNSGKPIIDYINSILKIELPWNDILEKAIKKNTIHIPTGRSWKSLNKFFIPHGITLPGVQLEEEQSGIGTCILLIDTSASVNITELKQYGSIIHESFKYYENIVVIDHDTHVKSVKEYKSDEGSKFIDDILKYGFKGRGGTSHNDCLKYIDENYYKTSEQKDMLSSILFLTDGYSNINSILKNNIYEIIKDKVPLVFTLTSNVKLNIPEDYKENCIQMNIEK